MLTLVNILIAFFIFLILYQIILASNPLSYSGYAFGFKEGLENQYNPYDTNNPSNALILAQQNAGNIAYLKERLDSVEYLNKEVQDISGNVVTLQNQMNGLLQAQQEYANQLTGGTAPQITGAVDDGDENTNNP